MLFVIMLVPKVNQFDNLAALISVLCYWAKRVQSSELVDHSTFYRFLTVKKIEDYLSFIMKIAYTVEGYVDAPPSKIRSIYHLRCDDEIELQFAKSEHIHNKITSSRKLKPQQTTMDKEQPADMAKNEAAPSLLSIFHEDVLLCILGFVADVPFEVGENNNGESAYQLNCCHIVASIGHYSLDSILPYSIRCFRPFSIPARPTRSAAEQSDPIDPYSSLTHTLPLVSRQFHRLCSTHDLFWKSALLRLAGSSSRGLWEDGLKRLVYDAECRQIRDRLAEDSRRVVRRDKRTRNVDRSNCASEDHELPIDATNGSSSSDLQSCNAQSKEEILLDQACQAIEQHPPENHTATSSGIYQCIYRSILQHHIRYQAPVFYMPTSVRLGVEYGLHFFEPRYRILISEVMSGYPVSARRGQRIHPMIPGVYPTNGHIRDEAIKVQLLNFLETNESLIHQYQVPTFIHAHQSPLAPNTPATIVQVTYCQISPDGRADVMLNPIAYIWLQSIWERPGTGGLFEARGLRMETEVGKRYEVWCAMSAFGNGDGRGRGQMLPIP